MKNMNDTRLAVAAMAAVLGLLIAGCSSENRIETPESSQAEAAPHPALMEPVKSVYDSYLQIQTDLAADKLEGVSEEANKIATAVREDVMQMLPSKVADQAEALAKAETLKAAREALEPLSASLIAYLEENEAGKGVYHEGYCPMVEASWLQAGTEIRNPYMGKKMLECGTLKN